MGLTHQINRMSDSERVANDTRHAKKDHAKSPARWPVCAAAEGCIFDAPTSWLALFERGPRSLRAMSFGPPRLYPRGLRWQVQWQFGHPGAHVHSLKVLAASTHIDAKRSETCTLSYFSYGAMSEEPAFPVSSLPLPSSLRTSSGRCGRVPQAQGLFQTHSKSVPG